MSNEAIDPQPTAVEFRALQDENRNLKEEINALRKELNTLQESFRVASTLRKHPRILLSSIISMEKSEEWTSWTLLSYHEVIRHFIVELELALYNEGFFDFKKYPWKLNSLFTFYTDTLVPFLERYHKVMSGSYLPWLLEKLKEKAKKKYVESNNGGESNENQNESNIKKEYQSLLYNEYTKIEIVYEAEEVKFYQKGTKMKEDETQEKDGLESIIFDKNCEKMKEFFNFFRAESNTYSKGNSLSENDREKFLIGWKEQHLEHVRNFISLMTEEMNLREALIPQILEGFFDQNEEHAKVSSIARSGISTAHIEITMVYWGIQRFWASDETKKVLLSRLSGMAKYTLDTIWMPAFEGRNLHYLHILKDEEESEPASSMPLLSAYWSGAALGVFICTIQ